LTCFIVKKLTLSNSSVAILLIIPNDHNGVLGTFRHNVTLIATA
jgi:hypothetical protein